MRTRMLRWLAAAALLGIPVWANAQSSCSVSAPTNGFLGTCPTTLASGASCQFTCASGYNINGPVTSCSNGVLTAQTCTPAACAVNPPLNGGRGSCPTSLPSGNSCEISCNSGYTVNGAATTCSLGVLTSTQTCSPSSCSVSTPPNGNLGTCPTTLASGSSCSIACNNGYSIVGGPATTCSFGTLTEQACSPNPCAVSAPANGAIGNCPSSLPSGNSCSFTCFSGYMLNGAATTCSAGVLTPQTCTATSCSVTAPANGTLGTCSSTLTSGSSCQFTCNSGFTLNGAATSCSNGVLTPQSCTVTPPPPGDADGPIPLWALGALGVGLFGIASRRKKAA